MPKRTEPGQDEEPPDRPGGSDKLPNVADIETVRLAPTVPLAEERRRQIAEHEQKLQRLQELAQALANAVRALDFRIRDARDPRLRSALEHDRTEMERMFDQVDAQVLEHANAIERLERQQ